MVETASYNIITSDGDTTYTVNENSTNTDTSISLIGHGMPDYGTDQNTNFLHMLEHFSKEDEPRNPIVGQIWYRKCDGNRYELRVCKSTTGAELDDRWDKLSHVLDSVNSSETYSTGDIWYDSTNKKLKIYDSGLGDWNTIGPTNIVHSDHLFDYFTLDRAHYSSKTYTGFDMSVFKKNIEESTIENVTSNGSLSLVTMQIMAKEFINDGVSDAIRCCSWVYKFNVRSRNTTDDRVIEMIGAPSYELIGRTDDTDWENTISIDTSGNSEQLIITFKDNGSAISGNNDYISIGIDTEIVRV